MFDYLNNASHLSVLLFGMTLGSCVVGITLAVIPKKQEWYNLNTLIALKTQNEIIKIVTSILGILSVISFQVDGFELNFGITYIIMIAHAGQAIYSLRKLKEKST